MLFVEKFVDVNINQRGRTVKNKTHVEERNDR